MASSEKSRKEPQPAPSPLATVARHLQHILQNIPDYAIFSTDAGGYVTEWTEGAERVKGWRAEEIVGQHVSTFYTPEQIASGAVDREIEEATCVGRAEREDWRVRKGGERFWGNEIATAMYDGDGKVIGFTKISRDLSARKRAEDALRASEERHRLLIENARDYAIFMIDAPGRVMTWNTGAERIFGYNESEIVGQDAAVLFVPGDRAKGEHQKELATAAAEGRASDDRWQQRKGGEVFFASGLTSPLRDSAGNITGFVKICRDLTEQQKITEQRETLLEHEKIARLEAERAMLMRDEFLAVVSHELRTPLTAILLWAKMLRSSAVREQDFDEAIEAIIRSADSQRQLIEDLLDISGMISGKLRLNMRETDLSAVVEAAVEAVRPMADAKGVDVTMTCDGRTGCVMADPDRVQQVVWNLLNNAVKFTDGGGRVTVALERAASMIRITVADNGRGISSQFLPHVFERFRQADASITRAEGGLGLGLSISQQLVELHGGTIRARSAGAGRGSVFTVELPLADVRLEAPPQGRTAPHERTFAPSPVLRDVRVLLVEDEADTRTAVQRLLEQCEAEVIATESAALAVAAFRDSLSHQRLDVLVSDIGMPVQDGYELMREIRRMEADRDEAHPIPAVAMTAYAREEERLKAKNAGFHVLVRKPVEPAALVEAVVALARPSDPAAESY
ncbi:MAG TPA: PAS domain S-box protein [Tepidisphaeraceae bacterium]|jgi:PAS domain S-box-containing protein